jgi:hypothetical protein
MDDELRRDGFDSQLAIRSNTVTTPSSPENRLQRPLKPSLDSLKPPLPQDHLTLLPLYMSLKVLLTSIPLEEMKDVLVPRIPR